MPNIDRDPRWQPTYAVWALANFAWTAIAGLAASLLTPVLLPSATGWGLPALLAFFTTEGASGFGFLLGMAAAVLLLGVPPGMMSLFLVALTDTRRINHPAIAGIFFAVWTGWLLQSIAGALFGLIFGAVAVGGTSLTLHLAERLRQRRR